MLGQSRVPGEFGGKSEWGVGGGPGGIQVAESTGVCMGASATVASMLHRAMFIPRSAPPLHPAANVEFEKHLAGEIETEKEV